MGLHLIGSPDYPAENWSSDRNHCFYKAGMGRAVSMVSGVDDG